jgi:methyl-accepting chemotaxis protein
MLLGAALLLLASTGCGERKKLKNCRVLVDSLNQHIGALRSAPGAKASPGGNSVGQLRALAKSMDALAKATQPLAEEHEELAAIRKEYHDLVKEVAAAARQLAKDVDKVDLDAMRKSEERMNRALQREDGVVAKLNSHCQAP